MKGMEIGMIIRKKWRIYILAILVIGAVSASIFFISKNSKASKLYAVPVLSEVFMRKHIRSIWKIMNLTVPRLMEKLLLI